MPLLEQKLASVAHAILYLLMIVMPLSGWLINSAADIPFKMFWLIQIPDLVAPDKFLQELAETVHLALFWIFASVLALHMAAALKHHFADKDKTLSAMLPMLTNKTVSKEVDEH